MQLFDVEPASTEATVIKRLAETFWPGPLSIVAKARLTSTQASWHNGFSRLPTQRLSLPPIITANTGDVAVRSPANPVARALIAAAGCPIAAPSANRFGHISPTSASHVLAESLDVANSGTGQKEFFILQEGDNQDNTAAVSAQCKVGLESTVVRLELAADRGSVDLNPKVTLPPFPRLAVLRLGAITPSALQETCDSLTDELSKLNGAHPQISVYVPAQHHNNDLSSSHEEENKVSPGMLLSHYAPCVPTFLVSFIKTTKGGGDLAHQKELGSRLHFVADVSSKGELQWSGVGLRECVLVDPFGRLSHYEPLCGAYVSVPASRSRGSEQLNVVDRSSRELFSALRKSETVALENDFKRILIHDFMGRFEKIMKENVPNGGLKVFREGTAEAIGLFNSMWETSLALYDRIHRAASGRLSVAVVSA
eukprot:GHVN01069567.1.p1 GENE.GHVN01069567.1~~GHVN01069567.1.p1  ORF type:complete len:425 (-),score=34.93 GHVN01069567.1:102-1376(-)